MSKKLDKTHNIEESDEFSNDKRKYYKKFIKYREKYMRLLAEVNHLRKQISDQQISSFAASNTFISPDYSGYLPVGSTADVSLGSSCGLFLQQLPEIGDTYTTGLAGIQRDYTNYNIGNYRRTMIKTADNNRHITPAEIKQLFDADWWFNHETSQAVPNVMMANIAKSILGHYRMCGYAIV
jgi:hypothetical protein